ncbi:MAG: FAD-dependent oxidoreductase, partial [Burkholderiales bacterium]|nr:FAD-dependent oxidoreductase [Burkholderiales bacterium]
MSDSIVIIGGGHAAASLCAGLAEAGLGAGVHLVCAEAELPYQRPPLSKAFLKNPEEALQWHRAEAWYADAGITLHRADPALAIDRAARRVKLQSGAALDYERLVIATGAVARRLPQLGADLANVALLRSAADARRLREQLAAAASVTVLGG